MLTVTVMVVCETVLSSVPAGRTLVETSDDRGHRARRGELCVLQESGRGHERPAVVVRAGHALVSELGLRRPLEGIVPDDIAGEQAAHLRR